METDQDSKSLSMSDNDDNLFSCGLLILIEQFLLKNVDLEFKVADLEFKVADLKSLRLVNRYLYDMIPLATLIHFPNKKLNLDFSCILDKSMIPEFNTSLDQAIPCYDHVPNLKGSKIRFLKVFKKRDIGDEDSEWFCKTKLGPDGYNTVFKMIRNEDLPKNQNILEWVHNEMNKMNPNTNLMIESAHLSHSLIRKQHLFSYQFPKCYIMVLKNRSGPFDENITHLWHDFRFIFDCAPNELPFQEYVVEKRGIENLEIKESKSKIQKTKIVSLTTKTVSLKSTTKRTKPKLKFDSDSKPKFDSDIKIYQNYKISDGKDKFNIKIFANPETKQFTGFYDKENNFDTLFYSNLNIPTLLLQKLETKFQFTKIKTNSHSFNTYCSKILAYKYCLASLILNHIPIWKFILEFKDLKLEFYLHYEDQVLENLQFKESKFLSLQYLASCNGRSIFNIDFAGNAYKIYFNFEKRICHIIDTDFSECVEIRIFSTPTNLSFDHIELKKLSKLKLSFKGKK